MSRERYFFEAWLRGEEGDEFRAKYGDDDSYHPHVTLVQPGILLATEKELQEAVVGFLPRKISG